MKRNIFLGTFSALTLGAVLAASGVPAAAQSGGAGFGPGPVPFEQLDKNGDGVLSADEFTAPMKERLSVLDTDGNGEISAEELQAARQAAPGQQGPKGQRGDGQGRMQAGKGDCDGHRKGGRMDRMHGKMGGHMGGPRMGGHEQFGRGGFDGPRGFGMDGPRGMMTEEQRQERAQAMIEMKDANGDGLLSVEELAAAPDGSRIFTKMDADGDGAISKEEFDAARVQFMQMRGNPAPQN